MKQEIFEFYEGNFINPLGRPYVLLIGSETDDKLTCEKYIIYEELSGTYSHWGEQINAPIIGGHFDNLNSFIKDYALEHCISTINFEVFKEREKDTTDKYLYSEIKVSLRKVSDVSIIMYLKDKAPRKLDWIEKNTNSIKFKELIKLLKGITITKHGFEE
jgi:hypothetical protein